MAKYVRTTALAGPFADARVSKTPGGSGIVYDIAKPSRRFMPTVKVYNSVDGTAFVNTRGISRRDYTKREVNRATVAQRTGAPKFQWGVKW